MMRSMRLQSELDPLYPLASCLLDDLSALAATHLGAGHRSETGGGDRRGRLWVDQLVGSLSVSEPITTSHAEYGRCRAERRYSEPTWSSIKSTSPSTRSSSATVTSPAAGVRFGSSQRNSTGRDVRRKLGTRRSPSVCEGWMVQHPLCSRTGRHLSRIERTLSHQTSDLRHQPSEDPLTRTYWRGPTDAVLQKSASLEPTPDPWGLLMM